MVLALVMGGKFEIRCKKGSQCQKKLMRDALQQMVVVLISSSVVQSDRTEIWWCCRRWVVKEEKKVKDASP